MSSIPSPQESARVSAKKVKRASEARKEQNRIASRQYRHKRKQKLALLDQLLVNPEDNPTPGIGASTRPADSVPRIDVLPGPEVRILPSLGHPLPDVPLASAENAVPQALFGWEWNGLASPAGNVYSPGTGAPFGLGSFGTNPSGILGPSLADNQTSAPGFSMEAMRTTNVGPEGFLFAGDYSPIMQTGVPPGTVAPIVEELEEVSNGPQDPMVRALESLRALSLSQKRQVLGILKIETSPDDGDSQEVEATTTPATKIASPRIRKEMRRYEKWLRKNLANKLPDVKVNTVHLMQGSFYGAIFANSYAIGCHDKEVLLQEDGLSPFWLSPTTGINPAQIELVQPRFANVPKDLSPVAGQLTQSHHPYLDVIPFTLFRERAMAALACNPPMFDEEMMCKDFTADGLICWGSQSNDQGMEAGVPWDSRSWEPKVWFLKKYWFLVGGWEDEMWKSARWWHVMRDEKINHNDKFDFD